MILQVLGVFFPHIFWKTCQIGSWKLQVSGSNQQNNVGKLHLDHCCWFKNPHPPKKGWNLHKVLGKSSKHITYSPKSWFSWCFIMVQSVKHHLKQTNPRKSSPCPRKYPALIRAPVNGPWSLHKAGFFYGPYLQGGGLPLAVVPLDH